MSILVLAIFVHTPSDTITLYAPIIAVEAFGIKGFCKVLVKPFGPVQAKLVPEFVVAYKFNVLPAQIGELLDAVIVGAVKLFTEIVNCAVVVVFIPQIFSITDKV